MTRFVLLYLLLVNLFTFLLFGIDKRRAKRRKWRIPELTLLLWAAAGGSLGAWLGMSMWRHKTRHKKFRYGVPLLLLLHAAAAYLLRPYVI